MRAHHLAASVVAILALGLAACGGPVSKVPPSPTALPPLADVLEYRASAARTGVYPGPGPVQEPVLVWSRTIETPVNFNSIIADGLILFGGGDSNFYALDARTGAERWRFTAGAGFNLWGSAADGTVVIVSDDNVLHALDLATGRERWSHSGMAAGTTIVDGVVYAPGTDDHVYGLDLATGKERWAWTAPANVVYFTVVEGVAYASVEDGRLYAISIVDNTERWHLQTLSAAPRVAEIDGDVVVASGATWEAPVGELFLLDRETGTVRWKFRTPTGYMITAGSTADGVTYAGTWDGTGLYAFPTTGAAAGVVPQPIWYAPITGQAYKNEAIAGDLLYVPTEAPNEILAVGKADGAIHWRLPQADVPNSTLVSGGMLFTSDKSGTIAAWAEPAIRDAIGSTTSGPLGVVAEGALPPDPFTIMRTLYPTTTGLKTLLAMDVGPDGLIYALDAKPSVTVIDPATGEVVRTWGRQGTGEGEFDLAGLGNIAVGPDGSVTVTDSGNHRLQVFSADGTFIRQIGSFGTADGQFSHPFRIASDNDGSIYVLDDPSGSLTKFDRDGTFVWRIPGSGTQSAAQLNDGTIVWLKDHGRVQRLDPATGAELDGWGGPGREAGGLDASCVISVDSVGNEYIFGCDPVRTQVFDPNHRLIGGAYAPRDQVVVPIFGPDGEVYGHSPEFSSDDIYVLNDSLLPPPDPFTVKATLNPATTGLAAITALSIGPDGLIYVIDVSDQVSVIDPVTGSPVRTWGKTGIGPGEFDFHTNDGNPGIGAIAVGTDGLVYVGDGNNHRYQVFEPDGTFVRQAGSFGNRAGEFTRISQIAADRQGNVYAVDGDTRTLSKFDPTGGFLWRVGGDAATPPLDQINYSIVARPDGRLFQMVEGGPVVELDPDSGAVIDTWGDGPKGTLSFDSADNAYGVDYEPPATQVFDPKHRLIGGTYGLAAHYTVIGPHDEAVSWHEATIDLMDVHLPTPGAGP